MEIKQGAAAPAQCKREEKGRGQVFYKGKVRSKLVPAGNESDQPVLRQDLQQT